MINLSKIFEKKKTYLAFPSIAQIRSHKYSTLYMKILYYFSISDIDGMGIIFLVPENVKISKYFLEFKDLFLLSEFIKSWFEKFQPNKVSLIYYLCKYLFSLNVFTFD